jgi:hypothetical protein
VIVSALLVLAQDGLPERQVRAQFCTQPERSRRRRCQDEWRDARR